MLICQHFQRLRTALAVGALFFLLSSGVAQTAIDSVVTTNADTTTLYKSKLRNTFRAKWNIQPHSPLKATVYSALFPGAGQIYNGNKKEGSVLRKYWKVPMVYASLATCIGFIDYNTKNYRYFKQQFIYEQDDDLSTIAEQKFSQSNSFYMERHKKWLDISYFSLVGVYLLQVIEANIDAHLFYYDVSKDLGLHVYPTFIPTAQMRPGIGFTMTF